MGTTPAEMAIYKPRILAQLRVRGIYRIPLGCDRCPLEAHCEEWDKLGKFVNGELPCELTDADANIDLAQPFNDSWLTHTHAELRKVPEIYSRIWEP